MHAALQSACEFRGEFIPSTAAEGWAGHRRTLDGELEVSGVGAACIWGPDFRFNADDYVRTAEPNACRASGLRYYSKLHLNSSDIVLLPAIASNIEFGPTHYISPFGIANNWYSHDRVGYIARI